MSALAGVRVLDLTTVVMGPYASQILGDHGADVIKIEAPAGDILRYVGPARSPGMGSNFLAANRNKRSLVLDLKQPPARDALKRLAATADVLLHNVRPAAMARLGLAYGDVVPGNPRLIYVAAVGYGESGRYAGRPAYDDLIQGASGLAALIAEGGDGTPRYVPMTLADRTVGLHVANAVMAALLARLRTGKGQAIEVPMFETFAAFVMGDHLGGLTFDPPQGPAGYARVLSRDRRPYATRDGHICVLIYNDKQWRTFFDAIGRPELIDDPRFADHRHRSERIDEVYAFVADLFRTRTTAEWQQLLEAADIPVMPLHTIASLTEDPHLVESGVLRWTEHPSEGRIRVVDVPGSWSETPPSVRRPAPRLGEHSAEVLREAGLTAAEIEALAAAGATNREA
jgi:crotonobetainyl-CoA:carnitine CoA-transferase CaiB-like acyl-CoA transferase